MKVLRITGGEATEIVEPGTDIEGENKSKELDNFKDSVMGK